MWQFFYADNLTMSKRWVYTELVKDKDDTHGLLAYSLYKFEKNEFAECLRATGETEEKITEELKTFHRQTVSSPARIETYREKAEKIIENIFDQLDVQIREGYEEQLEGANVQANEIERLNGVISQLNSDHKKELDDAREDAVLHFHRTVAAYHVRQQGWLLRTMQWQWNGFAGVFAAILFAIGIYGLCTLVLPQQSRDDVVNGAISNLKNSLFQQPNVKLNSGVVDVEAANPSALKPK
ncbi:hypothetical protein [Pectobacterium brasiliense]|uniref:hypothetical protein n=1 Tax=Pectobacterium brasiliense TaxID=180957 RepID=UPI00068C4FBD|nr:hypothetical protein [Pectobacterium brasiliense]